MFVLSHCILLLYLGLLCTSCTIFIINKYDDVGRLVAGRRRLTWVVYKRLEPVSFSWDLRSPLCQLLLLHWSTTNGDALNW